MTRVTWTPPGRVSVDLHDEPVPRPPEVDVLAVDRAVDLRTRQPVVEAQLEHRRLGVAARGRETVLARVAEKHDERAASSTTRMREQDAFDRAQVEELELVGALDRCRAAGPRRRRRCGGSGPHRRRRPAAPRDGRRAPGDRAARPRRRRDTSATADLPRPRARSRSTSSPLRAARGATRRRVNPCHADPAHRVQGDRGRDSPPRGRLRATSSRRTSPRGGRRRWPA